LSTRGTCLLQNCSVANHDDLHDLSNFTSS
jgi:hypothetical protein